MGGASCGMALAWHGPGVGGAVVREQTMHLQVRLGGALSQGNRLMLLAQSVRSPAYQTA